MDGQRFDELTRALGFSLNRKRFLAFVAGIAAPVAVADSLEGVDAKKGKKGKGRKGRGNGGVSGQGGGVCDTVCAGGPAPNAFCGNFGNCGSDDDCIGDPSGPICCTNAACGGGAGEGACCSAPGNAACGDTCFQTSDCGECPNARCIFQNGLAEASIEGEVGVCASQCTDVCIGDCSQLGGDCSCFSETNGTTIEGCFCTEGCRCEGGCLGKKKKVECPDLPGCVCDGLRDECTFCPGTCSDNAECREQGEGNCVCFLEVDTADPVSVDEVNAAGVNGNGGSCGECLGVGVECLASSECCGQLVCNGGTCRRKDPPKPKPKDRCSKHGGNCRADRDCCAQGSCYKGKCGEKDTHCKNDRECAQGYRCQGGPLAPNHRRCRKNGQRKRNRRN